jgi:hypothetical protein
MLLSSSVTGKIVLKYVAPERKVFAITARCFKMILYYKLLCMSIRSAVWNLLFKCILEYVSCTAFDDIRITCVLIDFGHVIKLLVKVNIKLNNEIFKYKKFKIIQKYMPLNIESEMEDSLRPELVSQNCSRGSGCCGIRTVNLQVDINLATSVTVRGE